jgi:hypothetical protein
MPVLNTRTEGVQMYALFVIAQSVSANKYEKIGE